MTKSVPSISSFIKYVIGKPGLPLLLMLVWALLCGVSDALFKNHLINAPLHNTYKSMGFVASGILAIISIMSCRVGGPAELWRQVVRVSRYGIALFLLLYITELAVRFFFFPQTHMWSIEKNELFFTAMLICVLVVLIDSRQIR